jgi:hydrogenase/urease accessory protein HupE
VNLRALGIALLSCVALVLASGAALGHGTRTASVEIRETAPGVAEIAVRSRIRDDGLALSVEAPCALEPVTAAPDDSAKLLALRCPDAVAGARLTVAGLGPLHTEAVVLTTFADGRTASHLVEPAEPSLELPRREGWLDVARSFVRLGAVHVLTGYDHLLFLLALVLWLKRPRAVLAAESAFTVSHSLSFSATALGVLHVAPAPAEACIALSLVLLALDLGRGPAPNAARGAAAAFVFGLVHGLGFAGGLAEAGVPDHDAASALVGFGLGVELGQVAFLLAALALVHLAQKQRTAFARVECVAPVLVGAVATSWLIERTLVCLTTN